MATSAASAAHWIAAVADIEVCTAREWIRVGRRLRVLPVIADLFDADELSYSKVRTLSRIATPENEQQLAAIAADVPTGALPRAIAAWLHRTSNDAELERHQHEQRSVTWRNEPDGLVTFTARLPPLIAGVLISQLTTRVMSTRPNTTTPIEQWPSLAQQHADALAHLLHEGAGAVTTEVIVHVRRDGATLDDGTALPMSAVERIAPEAFIRALIHDADSRPINASAKRRHPSTRQKRVVKERDRSCVDCGATTLLEYDHVPDFATAGHTSSRNCNSAAHRATNAATTGRRRVSDRGEFTDDEVRIVRRCTFMYMSTVSVSQARATLPELLDRVSAGEEVTITRHGVAVAVVMRPDAVRSRRADRALADAEHLRQLVEQSRAATLADAPSITAERAERLVDEVRTARRAR